MHFAESPAALAALIKGTGIKAAYCNDQFLVVHSDLTAGYPSWIADIPNPPGGGEDHSNLEQVRCLGPAWMPPVTPRPPLTCMHLTSIRTHRSSPHHTPHHITCGADADGHVLPNGHREYVPCLRLLQVPPPGNLGAAYVFTSPFRPLAGRTSPGTSHRPFSSNPITP